MPCWHFIVRYLPKIGLKSGKFPIIWKNMRIPKKVCSLFLELGWFLRPEVWKVGTFSKNLSMYKRIFENFLVNFQGAAG